ncbi:hypothetical protein V8C37DRAFT_237427 [Trichoderma ceciliae]
MGRKRKRARVTYISRGSLDSRCIFGYLFFCCFFVVSPLLGGFGQTREVVSAGLCLSHRPQRFLFKLFCLSFPFSSFFMTAAYQSVVFLCFFLSTLFFLYQAVYIGQGREDYIGDFGNTERRLRIFFWVLLGACT